MKALVISRPIYDYILPLVDFPQDGDKFYIDNSIKTITNVGTLTAITLAKYGLDVNYTGMVGDDETGRTIKGLLESYNINTKYIETSYTEKTCVNYKIYNQKTNKFTTIYEKSIKTDLTKYKYDFIPDVVIMDEGDYSANLAAINNYPNSKLIYIGDKYSKEATVYCNKCNYVITNLSFVSNLTGINSNLNKPKNIVQLFQKFIDLYPANLIIRLNNFDILYCVNDEVRLIKNVNKFITNKENLYNALLTCFIIKTNDIENSIKLTNKAIGQTGNELDMIKNIPDNKVIIEMLGNINTQNIVENTKIEINSNNTDTENNIEIHNNVTETTNNLEQPTNAVETSVIYQTNGDNKIEKL